MRQGFAALRIARRQIGARAQSSAERSTANPENNQQETPHALQEGELLSWLQFGEAYSALRGWRPIPAALLSHSVLLCSGTEDISLPTQRLQTSWSRPTQGKCFPDKHRSIGNKMHPVKSFATLAQLYLWKSITWHHSCLQWAPEATPHLLPMLYLETVSHAVNSKILHQLVCH